MLPALLLATTTISHSMVSDGDEPPVKRRALPAHFAQSATEFRQKHQHIQQLQALCSDEPIKRLHITLEEELVRTKLNALRNEGIILLGIKQTSNFLCRPLSDDLLELSKAGRFDLEHKEAAKRETLYKQISEATPPCLGCQEEFSRRCHPAPFPCPEKCKLFLLCEKCTRRQFKANNDQCPNCQKQLTEAAASATLLSIAHAQLKRGERSFSMAPTLALFDKKATTPATRRPADIDPLTADAIEAAQAEDGYDFDESDSETLY